MPFTLRELIDTLTNPVRISIWIAVTMACVISGPFESGLAKNVWASLGFWTLAVGYGIVLANILDLSLRRFENQPLVLVTVGKSVLFAAFYAPFLVVALPTFFPNSSHIYAPPLLLALNAGGIYLVVALTVGGIVAAMRPKPEPIKIQTPTILKRLPAALGRDVLHISSQDHYVDVRTSLGNELILMRFVDALEELEGLDGVRVHRSHWVNKCAVVDVKRSGSKILLRLRDGTEVPVSRSYRSEIEAAGWL